jgi:4-hydroxybenzoate polyprenyltransferase
MPPGIYLRYNPTAHPRRGRGGRRRSRRNRPLPLGRFAGAYLLGLFFTFAEKGLLLAAGVPPPWILAIGALMHMIIGYKLNRLILARLEWNPNFAPLSVVAKEKIHALLFWPLTYPVLLMQLWVVHNL